ncbi:MAG TPA: DUF6323 family protein [Bacillota bacterium]|nr:DUF6323 family protein [Bacillota bacterium]
MLLNVNQIIGDDCFLEVMELAGELSLFNSVMLQKQAVNEILKINEVTRQYGLTLTLKQAVDLVETRSFALQHTGRIEIGGGMIDKLITAFASSAFLTSYDYAETLNDLIELFYYYKNETLDQVSDDDLIRFMEKAFNGVCKGSFELLAGRELVRMAHNIRFGHAMDYEEKENAEEEEHNELY